MSAQIIDFVRRTVLGAQELPPAVRTSTGALVTCVGDDLTSETVNWGQPLRVTLVVRSKEYGSNVEVTEEDCHAALSIFAKELGKRSGTQGVPSMVSVLEGSLAMGWHYSIVLNLHDPVEVESVYESRDAAWPDLAALPYAIHETTAEAEVWHMMGRIQYRSRLSDR